MSTKGKPGRPRLSGDRYPSGDRKPTTSPTLIRRQLEIAKREARSQDWGDPIGRMLLREEITVNMCAAGREYAARKAAYLRTIAAPSELASPAMEAGRGKSIDPELSPHTLKVAAKAAEKARRRHLEGREAILAMTGGVGVLYALERVCVDGQEPTWADKEWIKPGLQELERLYRPFWRKL